MNLEDRSLGSVIHDQRTNALLGWGLTAVVAVVAASNLLSGSVAWGGFWLALVVGITLPAAVSRDWTVIVPWLLPFGAVVAVGLQTVERYPEVAGYIAVVTLALVAVIELDRFTRVDMSRRFTVAFAVMTTMALQAVWTVVQFASDRWLGSEYLGSQTELQIDIVAVTVVALVIGGFFVWYFDRFDHAGTVDRPLIPEEPR
jgi:hypothetical protein